MEFARRTLAALEALTRCVAVMASRVGSMAVIHREAEEHLEGMRRAVEGLVAPEDDGVSGKAEER